MVDRKFMYAANTASDGAPYLFGFGTYTDVRVIAFGRSVEDALDSAIDWVADNHPGLLADDAVREEFARLEAEWRALHPNRDPDDVELHEIDAEATIDTTCGGSEPHYVNSWEWTVDGPFERRDLGRVVKELRARFGR